MEPMASQLLLVALGFAVGAFGTLIGAGGGFILVPVMLIAYPGESPEAIACVSLAVVFFNAASGSVAYARMKRIDYRSGLMFAAATVPGAVLGALTTGYIPRSAFNMAFGILMICAAVFLVLRKMDEAGSRDSGSKQGCMRRVVERDGTTHEFSYNTGFGMGLSLFVGYASSLLGIGGGIIHVPCLVRILNFPVHIATATSHFILAIMAFAGSVVHVATGSFSSEGAYRTVFLSAGVLLGAQLGARLSGSVRGFWIILGLSAALAFVGVRIIILSLA